MTITKSFNDHNIELVAGATAIKFDQKGFGASGQDLPAEAIINEDLRYVNLTPDSSRRSFGYEAATKVNTSLFARVLYNYKEKYLATAAVRRDGSSSFGNENKYAIFPAFSLQILRMYGICP